MSDAPSIVLACQGLSKIYRQGTGEGAEVPVLLGVNLEIAAGERVALLALIGSPFPTHSTHACRTLHPPAVWRT